MMMIEVKGPIGTVMATVLNHHNHKKHGPSKAPPNSTI